VLTTLSKSLNNNFECESLLTPEMTATNWGKIASCDSAWESFIIPINSFSKALYLTPSSLRWIRKSLNASSMASTFCNFTQALVYKFYFSVKQDIIPMLPKPTLALYSRPMPFLGRLLEEKYGFLKSVQDLNHKLNLKAARPFKKQTMEKKTPVANLSRKTSKCQTLMWTPSINVT